MKYYYYYYYYIIFYTGHVFFVYSNHAGYISNRDTMEGSIFIQALCKELNEKWYQTDICSIASNVNKRIMQNYGRIQAPIFENQLGDLVFLEADSFSN